MRKHRLHKVFEPQSVAVIGASERPLSMGGQVLSKLIDSDYQGALYPVNPRHESLGGLKCYPSISAIADPVDLVVIAIPAHAVGRVMRECGEQGVGAAIVISAGFGEAGEQGQILQDEMVAIASEYNIALVGPNCLGVIRPSVGLNASFAKSKVASGHVAMIAQSGAFCTALLDWGDARGFGFSAVASLGTTADVGFGEVLDYLALDTRTKSILLYIEGVSDARAFLSGLRAAARLKPVIVVKSGRNEHGIRAAAYHSAAAIGADLVFDAAIRRAGAVRVFTVSQLFATAQTLAAGIRVDGSKLAILTNGGGPGVMAADRATDVCVPLAELSRQSLHKLNKALPPHWSHSNPVDILGDADTSRYQAATQILLADENVDGLLVLLSPQGMTDPAACAQAVIAAKGDSHKPLLTCWLGEKLVREGRQCLSEANIPTFSSPEAGVDAFGHLAAYRRNQNALLQAPPPLSKNTASDVAGARLIAVAVIEDRRTALSGSEGKDLLRAFHIPVSATLPAGTAVQFAEDRARVQEFRVGIARDPVFGPVISFETACSATYGPAAGQIELPPLNNYLARELITGSNAVRQPKTAHGLTEDDIDKLVDILRRVSEIACELPEIQTLTISPLLLGPQGVTAEGVTITVAAPLQDSGRYCHMAIHPYPPGLETELQLANEISVVVRPIRPEDAQLEREFVESLSAETKYFRFMNHMDKISPLMLARFTQIDYDREMALVAVLDEHTPQAKLLGVARYICNPDDQSCEFALTVADAWQKKGLGRQLMERLMLVARQRGMEVMEGDVLAQNTKMLRLCNAMEFHTVHDNSDPEVVVVRREL